MSGLKTKVTEQSVEAFLGSVKDQKRREDSQEILQLMTSITGESAKMWGASMVGFGSYRYKYASGKEGEWFVTGFSPRKQNLTLYIMPGFAKHDDLMSRLGKFKTGKSCLYIKKIEDVDREVLTELIRSSVEYMHETYPE